MKFGLGVGEISLDVFGSDVPTAGFRSAFWKCRRKRGRSKHIRQKRVEDVTISCQTCARHTRWQRAFVQPQDLLSQELLTVPVSIERLDICIRFLVPAHCKQGSHRTAEATDLVLRLVAAGRGVSGVQELDRIE